MTKKEDLRRKRLKAIIAYLEEMDEVELHKVNTASYKMLVRRRAEEADRISGTWKLGDEVFFVAESSDDTVSVKGTLVDIQKHGQTFVVRTADNAVWKVHPYFCQRSYQGAWSVFKRLRKEGLTNA